VRRALSGMGLATALACLAACSTGDQAFPPSGTLSMQVLDLTLDSQLAEEPGAYQFAKWSLSEATAEVAGRGPVSFAQTPCEVGQRILSTGSTCGFTGLVLEPGTSGTVTLRVGVTEIEIIRAKRPPLTATGDYDDDGHLDIDDDNCPYVANPGQENANAAEEGKNPVGDACSINNAARDTDADTVSDASDNCVYIANPLQADAPRDDDFADGVGDACEEKVVVTLDPALVIERAGLPFTIADSRVTLLRLDFKTKDSLTCDAAFTTCTIDPALVTVTVQ
jgi:hypothetical protein